jgi:hypothetical protein
LPTIIYAIENGRIKPNAPEHKIVKELVADFFNCLRAKHKEDGIPVDENNKSEEKLFARGEQQYWNNIKNVLFLHIAHEKQELKRIPERLESSINMYTATYKRLSEKNSWTQEKLDNKIALMIEDEIEYFEVMRERHTANITKTLKAIKSFNPQNPSPELTQSIKAIEAGFLSTIYEKNHNSFNSLKRGLFESFENLGKDPDSFVFKVTKQNIDSSELSK